MAPWQAFLIPALFALQGLAIHVTLGSTAFVLSRARRFGWAAAGGGVTPGWGKQ